MAWLGRFLNVFRAATVRDEIAEELRHHVESRTASNIAAGMDPREARADALRRFGNAAVALDRSHDADIFLWLETIVQDLRFGARSLRRNPGVTAVALLSLALAIGASTAIFSVVDTVLLRDLPYRDPGRIAIVWVTNAINGATEMNASVPNFDDWRSRTHTLRDLALYREADASFLVNGEADWIEYSWVYGDFFRLLGVQPALGRVFSAESGDAHEVVLSHRLWQSRFGSSPDAVGRTVNLSGFDFQIVGVMPPDFAFPTADAQLWASAPAFGPAWQSYRARRQRGFGGVAGRLQTGVAIEQAGAEMELITRQLAAAFPKDNADRGIRVLPLAAQVHGKTVPFMLAVLSGAVFFVLLIACANVANLLLARGAVRRQEIALRAALGAGRPRIVRQLVTESLLLSAAAGALGLLLASWGIQALVSLAPQGIARLNQARVDGRVMVFSIGLSLATGILFGLAPALRVSQNIGGRRQAADSDSRTLRRVFVIAQVALAVILLTGAGLLVRSFVALQAVNPGFRTDHVLSATLRFHNALPRERRVALYREAMDRLSRLPGVSAAGGVSTMFFKGDEANFGLRAVEGRPPETRTQWTPMTWSTIGGNYFQALGVPLLRGRFFDDRDTTESGPVVIVNETMARRFWPGEDPIGRGIKGFDPRGRNDEWVRVVGVVKDVHSRGLERAPMAQIYEAQAQSHDETEVVVVRGAVNAAALRDVVRSIDKTAVWMDVTTLDERLRSLNAARRFQTLLLSLFATVALALAGAGIFAMMHYSVAQRTREIGIRVAIGARPANVIQMILREGLAMAAAGVVLGLAGALALTRAIRSLLFETGPGDPATLGTVALLLAGIALTACYIPARRATKVDPMLVLRCE